MFYSCLLQTKVTLAHNKHTPMLMHLEVDQVGKLGLSYRYINLIKENRGEPLKRLTISNDVLYRSVLFECNISNSCKCEYSDY